MFSNSELDQLTRCTKLMNQTYNPRLKASIVSGKSKAVYEIQLAGVDQRLLPNRRVERLDGIILKIEALGNGKVMVNRLRTGSIRHVEVGMYALVEIPFDADEIAINVMRMYQAAGFDVQSQVVAHQ